MNGNPGNFATYVLMTLRVDTLGTQITADELGDAIDEYFAALSKSGQILIDGCVTVKDCDATVTYFLTPSETALDGSHANRFVREAESRLHNLTAGDMRLTMVGPSADHGPFCACAQRKRYVLHGDMYPTESPVWCMSCGSSVPLLWLPRDPANGEFYEVLSWQKARAACERLWLEGIAEATNYRQLSTPNSELTRRGRKICKEFERLLPGAKFYYSLFLNGDRSSVDCQECGHRMARCHQTNVHHKWQCDRCQLVTGQET